ncbi:MAG: hypothetical protein FWB98_05290 [Defluviitaleaceae bacterium]|nr:hypothetical protein [Defluviitaleaceae bacterium]
MTKILFISPPRMSRDMMAARVMAEARSAGVMIDIKTMTDREGFIYLASDKCDAELIMLCPNLRFLINKNEGAELLKKLPLIVIPSSVFGSLDGAALLRTISHAIEGC